MKSSFWTLLICFLLGGQILKANNIQIDSVNLTGQNTTAGFTLVEFDLSWDNSWRVDAGPSNWDAAWVFVKYRVGGGSWSHATLNYVDGSGSGDGHTVPPGAVVEGTNDGVGVFMYRSANGSGSVDYAGTQLRWNYAADGVADDAVIDVQVFAIEMVYVPEGAFGLGDGFFGDATDPFFTQFGSLSGITYNVTSEDAIPVGTGNGELYYSVSSAENNGDQAGPILADYPKGFQAFYMMKYEVTQDQWICFFNTLTDTQKANQDITGPDGKNSDNELIGNTVSYTTGAATTSSPARPVNYVGWEKVSAYLDWAGLRPFTELEYEKACRGPNPVVSGEFAWGNSSIHADQYNIINSGAPSSLILNPGQSVGNAIYFITDDGSPARVGLLAASAVNKNRQETGGSFYGIMELTGNVYERCLSVGTSVERSFTGTPGDGELNASGYANVPNWPTPLGAGASAYRGGSYANDTGFLRVGDRTSANIDSDVANGRIGFRGARTAE